MTPTWGRARGGKKVILKPADDPRRVKPAPAGGYRTLPLFAAAEDD